ncbi:MULTISPECIES: non-ribosomal peptide synthetase [Pseudonocardia]|uniref:Phenyloxazoline synthase MbtB n=2 Tax=Pseudonocardia TaxID=1847 RepID=A0A1Y2N052_PSEAH|nr:MULTISPECIES: non-ribosomal peptide synthetase [Pseudonocardia]OSY40834.1 Phenyloxazoline synthase MbtB [Pseudonocardia autotrophica]TDN71858.1 pyochelin synthetase [Pseudonocardia autotrophica]BBG02546.1 non-ribosomal peptide synthetase [Pseudonocardia autotrophica]GEC29309.1 non-ribosomal peptide synthetase [Pseudonocardia saturnea]
MTAAPDTIDPARLLIDLENLGVRLWADSGKLRFRAPSGVLTEEHRAALRAHRDTVLTLLQHDDTADALTADPAAAHEPFPLTDVQASYLLGRSDAFDYGGVACHGYVEVDFDELDPERLERAWATVVARHDMLRAVVELDGSQHVLPDPGPVRVPVDDLRGHDPAAAATALAGTRDELGTQVHTPDHWPLFDLRITRLDDHDVLHLSIDLLVCDYTSLQLLLAELDRAYTDPASLPPPPAVSFRDYVVAQRRLSGGRRYARDRAYWLDRIDDLPPAPELPLDPARPDGPPRFSRHTTTLDTEHWARLRTAAAARGVTPSGALLTAYAAVLARWSERPDLTLSLTLLSRLPVHPDIDRVIGDFTSVTLLAVRADDGTGLAERARSLTTRLFDDIDHRLFSGVEVVRELRRRRGPGGGLLPVVFTSSVGLGDTDAHAGAFTGTGRVGFGISQTPQVWLDCQVSDTDGTLRIDWDSRDGVLAPGVVPALFDAYTRLLHQLAIDPAAWDAADPVTLPADQLDRRRRVNDTTRALPTGLLHQPVLDRAAATPDALAVVAADGELRYGELLDRAHAVATELRRRDLQPGTPVAIAADKGVHQPVAVLGTLLAGGAYLPVDPRQPAPRIARILRDSGAPLVLTATGDPGWDVPAVAVADLPAAAEPVPAAGTAPGDLAYVIYTSGSTGAPKGVMTAHRAARNTVEDITERFRVGTGDRVLGVAALGFDLSVYDLFGVLGAGGTLVLPDPDRRGDPEHWAELVARHRITLWNSVPAQLQMLGHVLAGDPAPDATSLRLALLSGDWIPVGLPDEIRDRIPGLEVISLGGATEAAIWSIVHPVGRVDPAARSIPYGVPLANQTFHVLDATGADRPDWTPGELYIGGTGTAIGYLGDPDLTAIRFPSHPRTGERLYRTGDIGRHLPDGTIELLGRADDQIKIRGHRIEPGEIEAALLTHPAVRAAAVVAVGDRPLERRLAGFVELDGDRGAGLPAEFDDGLRERASAAARAVVGDLDPRAMVEFSVRVDRVALLVMAHTLRRQGLFGPGERHTLAEVLQHCRVAARHGRVIRRWLRALVSEGMLHRADDGRYHDLAAADAALLDHSWDEVSDARKGLSHGGELIEFLRRTTEKLPEIMRDEFPVQALLFPDGGTRTAEAAYKDNLISQYVNAATTAAVVGIAAAAPGHTVRVLEVGAGVGGTSRALVPALAGLDVEYHYTDVSRFFLDDARRTFADHPGMRYGLFDINTDFREQGHEPGGIDVLLAANVLHNSHDAGAVLARFAELVGPGGWLVFNEPTRDYYQIMTSMEFLMSPAAGGAQRDYEDLRRGRDRTFLELSEWRELLADAGFEEVLALPGDGDPLTELGQHAVVARVPGAGAARIDPGELAAHLRALLPEPMVPTHLRVVDTLPLTGNGKVDRAALAASMPAGGAADRAAVAAVPPRGDTEVAVAAVWGELLGLPEIGRDQDFFVLGGDSLLVSRLAARLRETVPGAAGVPWETLMRRLVEGPTVAAIATALERLTGTSSTAGQGSTAGGTGSTNGSGSTTGTDSPSTGSPGTGAAGPDSPLVELHAGRPGGTITVLVHDGSGGLAPYRELLAALTVDAPHARVLGLSVPDTGRYLGRDPSSLIVGLAGEYARILLDEVPGVADGSTRLHPVGYCMGGMLAAELARVLGDAGAELAPLTVVSSHHVPQRVDDPLVTEYGFARLMGLDPADLGFPADEAAVGALLRRAADDGRIADGAVVGLTGDPDPAVADAARRFAEVAGTEPAARLAELAGRLTPLLGVGADDIARLREVFRQSLHAVSGYRPDPYPDDIVLLRQSSDLHFMPGLREDMAAFWSGICLGETRIVDIDGDHFGCLRGDRSARVAALLRDLRDGDAR